MRKYFSKWKMTFMMMVLMAATIIPGAVTEAKTITKKETLDKEISYVGSEISFYNAADLKINKKSTAKSKKKIKTIKTNSDITGFSYHTKAYFKDSSAYNQYDDFRNAYDNAVKFLPYGSYTMRFLKPGTYTISYAQYSKEYLRLDYETTKYDSASRKYIDYYKLYDNEGKTTNELYVRKTTDSDETYYEGVTSKKIYTYSNEGGVVAASIKAGADKQQHVYCQPRNVIKTIYSRQYKVLKTYEVISSVQLGKAKITSTSNRGAYSSSSSSSRSFLTGSKGKLTVKVADKNYSITSIVVKTYDKEGKPVYTKVGNKKNVNFGAYKPLSKYNSTYSTYSYSRTSLFKPTTVYVFYKNKFTGAYSTVDKIEKDVYGDYKFTYTYKNANSDKAETYTSYGVDTSYSQSFTFYKK